MRFLRLLRALYRRHRAERRADRFGFLIEASGAAIFMGALVILGRLVAAERLGGARTYIGFVAWGLFAYLPVTAAITSPTTRIRSERTFGTLEGLLLARTRLADFLLAAGIFDALAGIGRAFLYLLLGLAISRGEISLRPASPAALLFGIPLAFLAAHGLGLAGAAADLVLDRGRSLVLMGAGVLSVLGGIYFPVALFPDPIREIVWLVPIVPLSSLARGDAPAGPALLLLGVQAAVYLALGRSALAWGLAKARTAGSLARRD